MITGRLFTLTSYSQSVDALLGGRALMGSAFDTSSEMILHCLRCGVELVPVPEGPDEGRPGCPTGHYVFYDNPAVTTFAFIRNSDGRYLALRRAHEPRAGQWDLPGGFIEAGEHPDESVLREIVEETGLTVALERVIGAYTGQYGDGGKHTVDIGYLARATGGTFVLSDEKSEAAWLGLADLPTFAFDGENAAMRDLIAAAGDA